jgi:tRNA(Ile2) C34 agmatinyltransferase TiaS
MSLVRLKRMVESHEIDCPKCGASLGYSGEVDKNTGCGRCGWRPGAMAPYKVGDWVRKRSADPGVKFQVTSVKNGKAYVNIGGGMEVDSTWTRA